MSLDVALLSGIVLLYAISLIFLSQNRYAGLTETLRVAIMPLSLAYFLNGDSKHSEKLVYIGLMCVAVIGLLESMSIVVIPNGLDSSNDRLQSVLQYANTTALLMMIGAFYAFQSFLDHRKLGNLICLAAFLIAFALTGSRISLIVLVVTGTVYALMLVKGKGKYVILCSVAAATIFIVLMSMFSSFHLFRISLFEGTFLERLISFQDAFKMLRGRWLLGIGSGNWQTWHHQYQTTYYNVRYIHNYYLQLFLDSGVVSPLLFVAVIIPAIVRGIKAKSVNACVLIAIALRALLDFDMIFASVGAIAMLSVSRLTVRTKVLPVGKIRGLAVVPLVFLIAITASEAFSSLADRNLMQGNLESSMKFNEIALKLNPVKYNSYFKMALSAQDIGQAEELLRTATEKDPSDLESLEALAELLASSDRYDEALELCERLITEWKNSPQFLELYYETLKMAFEAKSIDEPEYSKKLNALDQISEYQKSSNTL
ncbi:MAG: O-antigen ligase family protein [Clostridiales bacterium]|nr:O-antigen ligase family protein [Clostridiales bacterium]